jgi:hypothetical protein
MIRWKLLLIALICCITSVARAEPTSNRCASLTKLAILIYEIDQKLITLVGGGADRTSVVSIIRRLVQKIGQTQCADLEAKCSSCQAFKLLNPDKPDESTTLMQALSNHAKDCVDKQLSPLSKACQTFEESKRNTPGTVEVLRGFCERRFKDQPVPKEKLGRECSAFLGNTNFDTSSHGSY